MTKAQALKAALGLHQVETTLVGCGEGESGECDLPILAHFHGTPIPRGLRILSDMVRDADVVHVIGYRDTVGTAAALAAHRRGIPYLLEPAGMHRRRLRSVRLKTVFDASIGRRLLDRAQVLIATSKLEARDLQEDGIPVDRIRVRPNGVDIDGMLPLPPRGSFRKRIGVPQESPMVLALGRIAAVKNLLGLAKAISDLPGVAAVIAGPDDRDGTLPEIRAIQKKLGLEERLKIVPTGLWGRAKAEALADADCLCLPSATENFGNVAAEAACLGIPSVVSNMCGVAEHLDPAASRVVPYGDVRTLTSALHSVLAEPSVREAARSAAPSLRERLDWDAIAVKQVAIYQEALDRTGVAT